MVRACSERGEQMMTDSYHYRECGLDNVWLLNGYEIHDTPYGRTVSFQNPDELDAMIAKALTVKSSRLTGKELRFLRLMLGMTQKALGEMLGKQDQSVARWEKGGELNDAEDFLVRHIYRQTAINKSDTYTGLVQFLNDRDRSATDDSLCFKSTEKGWDVADVA